MLIHPPSHKRSQQIASQSRVRVECFLDVPKRNSQPLRMLDGDQEHNQARLSLWQIINLLAMSTNKPPGRGCSKASQPWPHRASLSLPFSVFALQKLTSVLNQAVATSSSDPPFPIAASVTPKVAFVISSPIPEKRCLARRTYAKDLNPLEIEFSYSSS